MSVLGELKIHVSEPSCDPYDERYDIVAYDPFAAISLSPAERTAMADVILTRDWTQTVIQISTIPARCLLNAMRLLRNKWAVNPTSGQLTVCTETDDTTHPAWTGQLVAQDGASPIVGQSPLS